jgi:hypothetical protein
MIIWWLYLINNAEKLPKAVLPKVKSKKCYIISGKQKPEKTPTRLLTVALNALVRNIQRQWIA